MVTTEAEKSRVLQAIEAGVSDYLVKPFTADTLRESYRSTAVEPCRPASCPSVASRRKEGK